MNILYYTGRDDYICDVVRQIVVSHDLNRFASGRDEQVDHDRSHRHERSERA